MIPDLLREHPQARRVLDRLGLIGGGPLGTHESPRFFARAHGSDEDRLLDELDETIDRPVPDAPSRRGSPTRPIGPSSWRGSSWSSPPGATWG
jgi:hypothetical protein